MSSSGLSSDDVSPVERRTGGPAVASGESLNPRRLVGRDEELERLAGLVAAAAEGRSDVLLVDGEPGVGKTALLEAARGLAAGFTCLAVRGVESEMQLAHAGLLGLLNPIRDLIGEVPPPQAAALSSALGWSSETAVADRFLVGAATLSLLAAAAERDPVLVLVDDLQWLDRESASALAFAVRRLGPDAVGVVMTTRTGAGPTDLVQDFTTLRVRGLSVADAAPLLPDGIGALVRERLVAETGGNPLALLEVSRGLDHAQMAGAAPLPSPLPAGDRLRGLYRATVERLSPDAWRAVLRLALSPDAGSEQGERETAGLDEARTHGVVVRDGLRHEFRHPLLRSAVLERATAAEQRATHADLAASLPAGSRAQVWHRASSVGGVDAALADELAASPGRIVTGSATRPPPPRSSAPAPSPRTLTWRRGGSRRPRTTPSWPETSNGCGASRRGCSRAALRPAPGARCCSRRGCWSSTPAPCRARWRTSARRRHFWTACCWCVLSTSWGWPASGSTTSRASPTAPGGSTT